MPVLRTLLLWLLFLSWGPATLHCALDEAGVLPDVAACCDEGHEPQSGDSERCQTDGCELVESRLIKQAGGSTQVAAPERFWMSGAVALAVAPPPRLRCSGRVQATREPSLPKSWLLDLCAALPARAP